ncbi:helix-turn-helix domain-containing protein [Microbacterium sp. SD291]|uniref:helix-turn-helix domain-containing protein n=1 Tax=Microbacterium sp. SD291 TaxID=2782007 RepID=UPI001A96C9E7|nr:helix-turn-helix transcriptional regulator [Microbacterium sp. SD291]MBO0979747.1 helix-turn-helix transcriptional regulator [Microbacterium sp. SD291]
MPRTPSPAAALIGKRIAEERKRRGITQDELAVLSGIDSSNIRSYESGRSMLSILTLVRIADALKAEPGHFLEALTPADFGARPVEGRLKAG